jgi:threonine synthase
VAHQWRGVIREYAERLPMLEGAPVVTLQEGGTPLIPCEGLSELTGANVFVKFEGLNPTGVVQGPRDDDGDLDGEEARRQGRHLREHRQHERQRRRLRHQGRHDVCRARARRQDRDGQAQPGVAHGATLIQVEGNFDDCLTVARKLAEAYPVELVNSVNPARIEGQKTAAFEVVDALGDAPDIHCLPVGNAGNITAYWRGYPSTPR